MDHVIASCEAAEQSRNYMKWGIASGYYPRTDRLLRLPRQSIQIHIAATQNYSNLQSAKIYLLFP